MGTISSGVYSQEHESLLNYLEPGTTYKIELILFNNYGKEVLTRKEVFITKPALVSVLPDSVREFKAVISDNNVELNWEPISSGGVVRILRNHLFFPTDINDGVVVYEGTGNSFVDKDILEKQNGYYYSIFFVNDEGIASAPAVLVVSKNVVNKNNQGTTSTSSVGIQLVDSGSENLLMPSDIFITTITETKTFDSLAPLPVGKNILISIPATAVPKHLKTILVSVYNPADNRLFTTYLLKLNAKGLAYEVNFRASDMVGEAKIIIELYDYEKASVRRLVRTVVYTEMIDKEKSTNVAWLLSVKKINWWWLLFILPLLIWWRYEHIKRHLY
jgi:hypothetical protein